MCYSSAYTEPEAFKRHHSNVFHNIRKPFELLERHVSNQFMSKQIGFKLII